MELEYKVYKLGNLSNTKQELEATFRDKDLAIEFVEHMLIKHVENYGVFLNEERIDMLL